jgi:tRNA-dihydrouridine synthase B
MFVGNHKISSKTIAAPMAGVTDRAFRLLCRKLGAGAAVSEMITSDTKLWNSKKSASRLDHTGERDPIIVQIAGANPSQLAEAARANYDLGADIIDINMGCPAKKVCKVASGSALMRDEKLVAKILEAVVNSVNIPVTLKTRTGWDNESKNIVSISKVAESSGIACLTIHGRTRNDFFNGSAEYDSIAETKTHVSIPVIANGDIDSPEKANKVLELTQADAVMVGRAAQGNPWIFREINHFLETGKKLSKPSVDEVLAVLVEHLTNLYNLYGELSGVRIARKHVGWYLSNIEQSGDFKKRFNIIETAQDQVDAVKLFLNQCSDLDDINCAVEELAA